MEERDGGKTAVERGSDRKLRRRRDVGRERERERGEID